MITIRSRLVLVTAVAAAALAACGGGDSTPEPRSAVAGAEERRHALANLTAAELTTLFDWAEYKFPSLFPKPSDRWAQPFAYGGETYWVSAYLATGNYLGITPDGRVFGLGNFVGVYDAAVFIGRASDYSAMVAADRCSVYPTASGCTTNPPAGSLNECTDPAAASLPDGFRTRLVYDFKGGITGEQVIVTEVTGNAMFEGKNARVLTSTTTGTNTVQGFSIDVSTVAKTYHEPSTNGLWKILGSLVDVTTGAVVVNGITVFPANTSSSKTVYTPAYLDSIFTLQVGQSVSVQTTMVTTPIKPPGQSVTDTYTETYKFEAKETITVPAGTFQTCRYRFGDANDPETTWFIVGKGVPAKIQSSDQTMELKPGSTYNGAPL